MASTRLQLHLAARDLKNLSRGLLKGKSDPFAVVTVRGDKKENDPYVVGQTDVYVLLLLFICCLLVLRVLVRCACA